MILRAALADQRVTGCRRDNGQPKRYKYRPRTSTRPRISSARTHTGRVRVAEYSIGFALNSTAVADYSLTAYCRQGMFLLRTWNNLTYVYQNYSGTE